MPFGPSHALTISHEPFPGETILAFLPQPFFLPRASVRDITRPAPCTVDQSAASDFSGALDVPSRITASSPIDPPTNPRCPGKAGVAPFRTTTSSDPA